MNNALAIKLLTELLGEKVTTSKSDIDIHGRSEAYFPHSPPDAVIYPENSDDILKVIDVCSQNNCPIVPWGTGTSLEVKCQDITKILVNEEQQQCVLTDPESISWLLNIRGNDVPRIPVVQACAIINSVGQVEMSLVANNSKKKNRTPVKGQQAKKI